MCTLPGRLLMRARDSDRTHGPAAGSARVRTPERRPETDELPGQLPLALQSSLGNAAVVQLLRQAGHPSAQPEEQQHEHEQQHAHHHDVQRSAVHNVLRGGGRPMDAGLREEMETRLGADFSDVRIHDDSAARASAAEVGARAYTSGHHVVVGTGGGDKHTLAHELTHVIQQRQGAVSGTDNGAGLRISDPSDTFERAAGERPPGHVRTAAGRGVRRPGAARVACAVDRRDGGPARGRLEEQPDEERPGRGEGGQPGQRARAHPAPHRAQVTARTVRRAPHPGPADLRRHGPGTARPDRVHHQQHPTRLRVQGVEERPGQLRARPRTGDRNDDPGNSGPDLNFTEDGAITPRSEQLEHVYDFIEAKVSAGAAVTPAELQNDFIAPWSRPASSTTPWSPVLASPTAWVSTRTGRPGRAARPRVPSAGPT